MGLKRKGGYGCGLEVAYSFIVVICGQDGLGGLLFVYNSILLLQFNTVVVDKWPWRP